MNEDDLTAVRALSPPPPPPPPAVLAAAMRAAGLEPGTTDSAASGFAFDDAQPIVLTPRRPRRTRRRMVSLTVALATTGVAAAVVGAVSIAGGPHPATVTSPGAAPNAPVSSGMSFPTDSELAGAQWFHIRTDPRVDPGCIGDRDAWFASSGTGSFERQPGQGASRCSLGDAPLDPTTFYIGDGSDMSYDQLQRFTISESDLKKLLIKNAGSGGNSRAEEYTVVITDTLREQPLPSTLRRELVDLLVKAPHVISVDGHDELGRPVVWRSLSTEPTNRRQWWGFDGIDNWMIAESTGAAGPDGGPANLGGAVIAIDTTAPTPLSGASPPTVVRAPSPCVCSPSPDGSASALAAPSSRVTSRPSATARPSLAPPSAYVDLPAAAAATPEVSPTP